MIEQKDETGAQPPGGAKVPPTSAK